MTAMSDRDAWEEAAYRDWFREDCMRRWEHEEWRCAAQQSEDAGELDDWYAEREAQREWDRDEAEWEADGPFEGYDDE